MTTPSYAGVGSRETPPTVLAAMTRIARRLDCMGYRLRSGAAPGADTAFERGALEGGHVQPEIFLPWFRFNGHDSWMCEPPDAAFALARTIHPDWERLSGGARALHARNCQQVLGPLLDDPVRAVVCWTPGGREQGGTATAIRIARSHAIPVFNLAVDRIDQVTDAIFTHLRSRL